MSIESNQKTLGYLYKFSILVEKVVINIGVPCKLSMMIKRGQQKIKLQNSPVIDPVQKCCYFDEIINLKTNVYWDGENGIFWDKKISFTLVIESQNGNKLAGISNYNLAHFLNAKSATAYEILKLNKCPDQNAKVYIKFDQSLIKELGEIDSLSSQNSLISDQIDDFHDITFQSSENQSGLFQNKSLSSIDFNPQQHQHPLKNDVQMGQILNVNHLLQQGQQQILQPNNGRVFQTEIINQFSDKQSDHLRGTALKRTDENSQNDENQHSQKKLNPINQNQMQGLNDGQKVFILETHMKNMIQEKESLKKELSVLKSSLSLTNDNLLKKGEECQEYFRRYEEIKNQRDDIKQKLDLMKKETEKIEAQVFGKVELMREDFCKQLYDKQQEIETITNENANLNLKVKELILDNKTCSERILKNEKTIEDLQSTLERLNFQSTQINHNSSTNIAQMTQEIESYQQQLKQQQENIQRLEYNKKRKEEDISKFVAEIHQLKEQNNLLTNQNKMLLEEQQLLRRKCEDQVNSENDQDQFMSFIDRPSQIQYNNNQSMNMKSFMSGTQNEFHSCIVQDFDDDVQRNNDKSFKHSAQDIYSRNILQEVKEENSFEKQMNLSKKEEVLRVNQSSGEMHYSEEFVQKATMNSQMSELSQPFKKEEDLKNIFQKYQSIEREYIDGKSKWEKIDNDNNNLKYQMSLLNQKFEKMENQLDESRKGLRDALQIAVKAGDQELIARLQNTIRI